MKKLKKCLKCGKRMHLIPMQTGKFKCRGYVAQCTACDYCHGMRDCGFGDATQFYNQWFKFKNRKRRAWKVFWILWGITVLFCALGVLPGFEQWKWQLICVGSFFSGAASATAPSIYGFKP